MPGLLSRYRVPTAIAIIGMAVFGTTSTLLGANASHTATDRYGLGSEALRAINVTSYGRDDDPSPVTAGALDELAALTHVESAHAWASTEIVLTVPDDAISLSLVTRISAVQPAPTRGAEPTRNGILLPESLRTEHGFDVGDTVTIEYIRSEDGNGGVGVETEIPVDGFFDDTTVGLDGPGVAYGAPDAVLTLLGASRGHSLDWMHDNFVFTMGYLVVDDLEHIQDVADVLLERGYGATALTTLTSSLPAAQQLMDAVAVVLSILLGLFLVVTAAGIASSVVSARAAEVGVLRALGWRRHEVLVCFVAQFAAFGTLIGAIGVAAVGSLLAVVSLLPPGVRVLGVALDPRLDLNGWLTLLVLTLAPVIVFVLASAIPVLRLARIAPDEVLRDIRR
ncbi:ABC transporter permease [Homoserinibacter sp. GY 40078]|uniref:ABC transporter permease n=1 Tax=Homoserinibacter sp. GY 40078 TaxID=2603275 RepID=UPI0011CB0599|nr:FtsX-like permease family protein [Homoserinibacter sp. GY 40078]TXK17743.1 FtsX-like permease family protein [Homoserinibacter sp. GY 40078]